MDGLTGDAVHTADLSPRQPGFVRFRNDATFEEVHAPREPCCDADSNGRIPGYERVVILFIWDIF